MHMALTILRCATALAIDWYEKVSLVSKYINSLYITDVSRHAASVEWMIYLTLLIGENGKTLGK
jgi:hypothetical protein